MGGRTSGNWLLDWEKAIKLYDPDNVVYIASRCLGLWQFGHELSLTEYVNLRSRPERLTELIPAAAAAELQKKFRAALRRRDEGEPWAYIWGQINFLGREFFTDTSVLIPRSDTEILWEAAVAGAKKIFQQRGRALRILELCTGSGCLIISLLNELAALNIPVELAVATDISAAAIRLVERNRQHLCPDLPLVRLTGDLLEPVEAAGLGEFDFCLANPPYVTPAEYTALPDEVRNYEPRLALTDEIDGLDFYRRILHDVKLYGRNSKAAALYLWVEHGMTQRDAITEVAEAEGWLPFEYRDDYAGLPRVCGFCYERNAE
ncbi:N5-glutamine methyltransferase family protein [Mageeibacillus indolicus]|uniref:N5-glutamine methyltransferase family protein n=1 Tax=Mageeibacillus indolicus TaxID=884684 RepID=UPI0004DD37C5|nr:peptide chain release factor N(5)-glutamine methyltransferase [Mageeibacillus indolicus]KFA56878.1 hypothetical protein HMPREF1632_07070 [Mageeibacillus indolicus 0009-5]